MTGKAFRRWRRRLRLSVCECAVLLHVTISQITKWERKELHVPNDIASRLKRYAGQGE